jgi:predicted DNA-binding transcriptional regulator AlpA
MSGPRCQSAEQAIQALEGALEDAPREQLPKLYGDVARVSASIWIRMAAPKDDEMLDADQAAAILGISVSTLYARTKAHDYPFVTHPSPGRVRFSKAGLLRWQRENSLGGVS